MAVVSFSTRVAGARCACVVAMLVTLNATASGTGTSAALGEQFRYLQTAALKSANGRELRLIEGDILTLAPQASDLPAAGSAGGSGLPVASRGIGLLRDNLYWEDGIVPYVISSELQAGSIREINQAIDHWNSVAGISLRPRESLAAGQTADFLNFQPAEGCASWVGRQGGEQEVWVAPSCSAGSIMHEIGHSLGLEHEHTREDRDQYIAIQWDNIREEKLHNFNISSARSEALGDYDYNSIMHYGPLFFSGNGQITIEPLTTSSINMGQRNQPSAGDIAAVADMFATDLSLDAQFASTITEQTELTVHVSNLQSQGAHDLELRIALDGAQVLTQTDNDWQCSVSIDLLTCMLHRLPGESSSSLVITLDDQLADASDLRAAVRSKTPDVNLVNNGVDYGSQTPPSLASALALFADDTETAATGGGIFSGGPILLMLFMFLIRMTHLNTSRCCCRRSLMISHRG